ncbi:Protein of unknown function [Luteibacter sp. UNC138MFCol5.1]|uniref:DUF3383 domain-containing protein n=1 Tax=Luteibacter sp. UNC138MFCol5.1 TaxID=1502774 RepID=UPI0008B14673|nr:DUF3383 domain-containing protein [Luteibacter sp. UNC138MFCol5.1]SEO76342.1 Protein of unknown function [Luteibacter sp. UNC138MFCol5.1]
MSLPLSKIVNVQLNVPPVSAARRDFGLLALFTPDISSPFAGATGRYVYAASQAEVESLFGTNSQTAAAARRFWAQTPKPKQMLIARWNKAERNIAATASVLRGGIVTATLAAFKAITDGRFRITVGANTVNASAIDFSGAADMAAVAALISAKVAGTTITWDAVGKRFVVTATAAGTASNIGFATDQGGAGTYIGSTAMLQDGQASATPGSAAVTIAAETLPAAFAALQDVVPGWYAAAVADPGLTDDEIEAASDWIQAAAGKVIGFTITNADQIEDVPANVYRQLFDKRNDRTVAIYDKTDSYGILSYLARALSVNFAANNSTITMKFKQLPGVAADELTSTEAAKCTALGINYYAYFDESPMVAEGTVIGGRFFDEVHILDWFVDAAQKEVFSALYASPTKVPLTDAGNHVLIARVQKVCREGVKNGAFAPGVWNGDGFGALATGDRLEDGFYVWANTVDNLSTSDREARRTTPIQVALKLASAIHSVDVLVNFDR